MKLNYISRLNNKELNNRLTNLVMPKLKTEIIHFTNDFNLVQYYIFPILVQKQIFNDVIKMLPTENFDSEEFNMVFCRYVLYLLLHEDEQ